MNKARTKAAARRPVEEIDAIMVKYSAWASSRAAEAPPADGIREVTYSSALRASNSRRKVRTDLVLPTPEPAAEPKPARRARQPKSSRPKPSPKHSRRAPSDLTGIHAIAPAKSSTGIQPSSNRVVSLSVRLAAEECALVKSRAAEARLSVSAYLRQCALDVDAMRIFVEKISAELQASTAAPHAAFQPALLAAHAAAPRAPGLLTRCARALRRLFSR